mgnify:FL=1
MIGVLIILWIVIGLTNLGKINTVAMAALFLLSLILSKVIFAGGGAGAPSDDSMTFGAAVELAVAMPLSWLPLISDYTREAKEPVKANGHQRGCLWNRQLLDVCDWNGSSDHHRRI